MTPTEEIERPLAITLLCIVMAFGCLASCGLSMSGSLPSEPFWLAALAHYSAFFGAVCVVGLWYMNKWAVWLYTGMTVLGTVAFLAGGIWSPFQLFVPALVLAVMYTHIGQMR